MTTHTPATVAEITPEWLTAALRESGTISAASVTALNSEPVGAGVGLLGELARIELTYDRPETGAPASLVAKLPTQDAGGRGLATFMGFYENEARFYRELAAISPMRAPRAYHVSADAASDRYALLLEDLSGLRGGDQVAGMTVAEARIVLREFARFHAKWWDEVEASGLDWVPGIDHHRMGVLAMGYSAAVGGFMERFGDRLSSAERSLAEGFGSQFQAVANLTNHGSVTICHGDARMDNIFFGSTDGGAPITLVDWQIIVQAPGTYDVGYMLSQSLDSADRKREEESLLREYHAELVANGVNAYPWERCWEDYRAIVLYCLVYPVFAGGAVEPANERGARLVEVLSERAFAAIRDLHCAELLDHI